MKFILILLISVISLLAIDKQELKQTDVWMDFKKLESNYLNLFKDDDISKQNLLLEENEKHFNNIYSFLMDKDLGFSSLNNSFYNEIKSTKRISYLNKRIENNSFANNMTAIHRDMFESNTINIKEHIYLFIKFYKDNQKKDGFRKSILNVIKSEQEYIKVYDPSSFKEFVKNDLLVDNPSSIKKIAFDNFTEYKTLYYVYKDFLDFMFKNKKVKMQEQIIEELYITQLISLINDNDYINLDSTNAFLKKANLDVGRLVGFITLMVVFILIGVFLNKFIVERTTQRIENTFNENDEEKELIHTAFFKIKLPIVILMIITSFHISLWVLYFNTEPHPLLKDVLHTAYILSIFWFVFTLIDIIALVGVNSKKYVKKIKMRQELVNLGILSSKVIVTLVAFIILLHFWGVNVSGILTGLGVSGVVVAFAAKDLLSNFFGTIKIILDDSYSQGDWIEVDGQDGTVASISFGNTKIRTFSNGLITIPNTKMSSSPVLNWNRRTHGRQIKTTLGLTYKSNRQDIVNAINEINDMLENHPDIATPNKSYQKSSNDRKNKLMSVEDTYGIKRTLFVKFIGFSEFSVDILIYAYSKTVNWGEFMDVRQDVFLKIWEILDKNNLEFAFPTQTLHFADNASAETMMPNN